METQTQLHSNVILIDAEYADRVAFDLTVNFERMITRRISVADLPRWLDCLALDGGLRPDEQTVQCLFVYPKDMQRLKCFAPSDFREDLDGKAFSDNMGEFLLQSVPVESLVTKEDFFCQCLETICNSAEVERVMVVADMETYGRRVKDIVAQAEKKDITLFAMQPLMGRGFQQELIGYSLMEALGIRADELPNV